MLLSACAYLSYRLAFSERGTFKSEGLSASIGPSSLGWAAAPMVEMGERAAAWCSNLVARILWRPSTARQTGKKKCVHMPSNLQTATIETSSAFFYPFPLGIQTQLFSEITSSRSLEMWLSRARKLVIYILRQSLELLY